MRKKLSKRKGKQTKLGLYFFNSRKNSLPILKIQKYIAEKKNLTVNKNKHIGFFCENVYFDLESEIIFNIVKLFK